MRSQKASLSLNSVWGETVFILSFCRFRAGFRHAFSWCPFIKVSEEDKMELQHTHTFRVTMTRSHRGDSAHAQNAIRTSACDASAELNQERDASKVYSSCSERRPDCEMSSAAKLMQNSH